MNTKLMLLCAVLWGAFSTVEAVGQTTYTWTGDGDGTNFSNANNWEPAGGPPSGYAGGIAQWAGLTSSNLTIDVGTFGISYWVNFALTSNQTNLVSLVSSVAESTPLRLGDMSAASGAEGFTLGDSSTNILNLIVSPPEVVHDFLNDSTSPAAIMPNVRWTAGGGVAYTLDFDGTGNWMVTNYLTTANNTSIGIAEVGTGTLYWTPRNIPGSAGVAGYSGPLSIQSGAVVLDGVNTFLNYLSISNNGIFEYNANGQAQALTGTISGTGELQVNAGTLLLQGQNNYSGTNLLSGGELILESAENAAVSGPLGESNMIVFAGGTLGYSANNSYDYSPRFSPAANQWYNIDTGGQNVIFTNGLTSSGGALTKNGTGTLALTGANTYTGKTAVNAGKLVIQGSTGTTNIVVADAAALGVYENGLPIMAATLMVGTNSGATLEFNNVTNTASAPLVANNLVSAGTITININSGAYSAVPTIYPLLTWTNGPAPVVVLGSIPGAQGYLMVTNNALSAVLLESSPALNLAPFGNGLQFSWTGSFKLQAQTDSVAGGLGANWADYPGGDTSPVTVPVAATNGMVFFRLISAP